MLREQGGDSPGLNETLSLLMAAIGALKEGLETLAPYDPGAGDSAADGIWYRNLLAVLNTRLPPVYAAYDAHLAVTLTSEGRRITCSSGCSACCRHFVSSVEPFELIALDHHLKNRGLAGPAKAADSGDDYGDLMVAAFRRARLFDGIHREERSRDERNEEEAEDRALYRYFLRGQACPFLAKDGTCGVYDHRPMACRMFYAESPPRFCAGKDLASPWNRNFQVELPLEAEEALARCSRLLEGLGLSEHLFTGLTEVNALFGRYAAGDPPQTAS